MTRAVNPLWQKHPTLEEMQVACDNTLVQCLGIEFTAIGADFVEARMPVDERTMQPMGLRISSPAPRAAATGSSTRKTCRAPAAMTASTTASASMPVMAAGTQTDTRGLMMRERHTSLIKRTISSFVMRWS